MANTVVLSCLDKNINSLFFTVRLDLGGILQGIGNLANQGRPPPPPAQTPNKDPLAGIIGGILDNVNVGVGPGGDLQVQLGPQRPRPPPPPTTRAPLTQNGSGITLDVPGRS